MTSHLLERRKFIKKAAVIAGGALILSPALLAKSFNSEDKKPEVSPNEDLMREHGILRRILLIYKEGIHRIHHQEDLDPALIANSAHVIQNFIENYHEKTEEHYIFPRFEKTNQLVDLVHILKKQHDAGRDLTKHIIETSNSKNYKSHKKQLAKFLHKFTYMYEPHAAREDTVLFPAFQNMFSENEYKELGEQFEDEEHKHFGKHGFETILSKVVDIEKALSIYDLNKFTPK